jgi:hypothetical protein
MSFSPPNTFASGDQIPAASLAANWQAVRDYVNAEVVTGDLEAASFDTQDVANGYPVLVNRDHVFETGSTCIHSVLADDTLDRRYIAGTTKNADITQQVVYVSVPGAARSIFLGSTADVLVEMMGSVIGSDTEASLAYRTRTSPAPYLVQSALYLEVDGDVEGASACYVFPEEGGTPSTQSLASGTSDFAVSAAARRPFYLFWCAESLTPGWHTFRLVCNPRSELLYVSTFSAQFEALETCGPTSYTGTSLIK